jgi:RNA polymerase sigma factor (TIGR02999 family)
MSDVTRLLDAAAAGNPAAAADLLPLVYDELRRLAAARLAGEKAGHTLQPTALVHEAYLRLVGDQPQDWNGRGHFFAAAAEAMRRILVESARRKGRQRHGGGRRRVELDEAVPVAAVPADDLLDLDNAITRLEEADPTAAAVVKLRYFVGLSMPEAAAALGLPLRTVERNWTYARTWLHRELARPS